MNIFHRILKSIECPKPVNGRWFVYLLECYDGSLYCGSTNDLTKRIMGHNAGNGAKYTRSRLPVKLVYSERYKSLSSALKRELEIKSRTRREKILLIKRKEKTGKYE